MPKKKKEVVKGSRSKATDRDGKDLAVMDEEREPTAAELAANEKSVEKDVTAEVSASPNKNVPIQERREKSRGFDPTQLYLKEIGFSPLLTAEEEVYYGRLVQKGDPKARRKMIESNLRLVVK